MTCKQMLYEICYNANSIHAKYKYTCNVVIREYFCVASNLKRTVAGSNGGEPARLPGWSFLPRSHLIPNSPIQNLISVHMSRQVGPLSEISLVYWRDLGSQDETFPI